CDIRAVASRPSLRALAAPLFCFATASACAGAAPSVDAKTSLEAELQRLPAGATPDVAVRRSRVLCALGRQKDALAALETVADHARARLEWRGRSSVWREVGDVHVELGEPQEALEAFGKRLKTAVALDEQATRASALVDTAYALSLMGAMSRADEALS